ncbi:MAG: hypothetical protein GF334_13790 [Candidatus Altiarchaeales archaeon]|nr:hypothetical protein [Candidatus Altiarchaeales archaeon]
MNYKLGFTLILSTIILSGCLGGETQSGPKLSEIPEMQHCNDMQADQDRENCYKDVAVENRDWEMCNEINIYPNLRNLCIQMVAIKKKDSDICRHIQNDDWRLDICLRGTGSK